MRKRDITVARGPDAAAMRQLIGSLRSLDSCWEVKRTEDIGSGLATDHTQPRYLATDPSGAGKPAEQSKRDSVAAETGREERVNRGAIQPDDRGSPARHNYPLLVSHRKQIRQSIATPGSEQSILYKMCAPFLCFCVRILSQQVLAATHSALQNFWYGLW